MARRKIILTLPVLMLTVFLMGCPKRPATTTPAAASAPPGPVISAAPTPGTATMPGAAAETGPGAPGVPAPGAPGVPGVAAPGAPGAPGVAAAPDAPTAPGTPGLAPGAPGAPSPAAAPGAPAPGRPPAPREFVPVPELKDIHFDFDKYDIRPGDAKILDENAKWMKANPNHLVLIEGHCDERGTNEYNLALGERRAKSTMNYLVSQGVQAGRMTLISYGEERPQCTEKNEACWAKNRRAHVLVKAQ